MEKVVNRLINESLVNVDRYNNNNSTWLIFTETKQWVIELTKDGTLWYNYNFFKNLFVYMSMDVVENQHYITKWVEDTIINGVKNTYSDILPEEYDWSDQFDVKEVIEIGVKHTEYGDCLDALKVLSLNGVEETLGMAEGINNGVEDIIQNGVKNTLDITNCDFQIVEDVIKEGVKHTEYGDWLDGDERFDDIIENGVKECIPSRTPLYNPMDFSVQYRENHRLDDVASVLEKGIKEVQPLPSQEGNMDYSNYYYRQGVPTKPHTQYVDDVITNGIKKTKAMDEWVNTDRIVDGVISGGSLIR